MPESPGTEVPLREPSTAQDQAIEKAAWQETIFDPNPRRSALLALRPVWNLNSVAINVRRNQPVEFVVDSAAPFLAYAGLEARPVRFTDYDDTLDVRSMGDADIELVSLDFRRYRRQDAALDLVEWLTTRLLALREATEAPILVSNWPGPADGAAEFNALLTKAIESVPGAHLWDVAAIAGSMGDRFTDARTASLKGTDWSDPAILRMAQELGLRYLPAFVTPRVKAIVVDLDNTLYAGVLGEDGVNGVRIDDEYQNLQRQLIELQHRGLFLAVSSRNEPADVDELFARRSEMLLRPEHLSASIVDWAQKADNIQRIADQLRIGVDAILFVDDNPGELASVAASLPEVRTLFAASPSATARALQLFPGISPLAETREDSLRARDLAASVERDRLASSAQDPAEYARSLGLRLTFRVDAVRDTRRMHELSIKTNQFNTALRRLTEGEIATQVDATDAFTVTVDLSDRLSDSGTIAFLLGTVDDGLLTLEEICISCRALGRELESTLIWKAVLLMAARHDVTAVRFAFATGPRNRPALEWLDSAVAKHSGDAGYVQPAWPAAALDQTDSSAVTIIVEVEEDDG